MVFVNKYKFDAPKPCEIDTTELVDKMLFEPLPNIIAHMMETGYVAAEYKRRKNSAIYDSQFTKDGNLDDLTPMPMYGVDLVDATNMRSSALDYLESRKKESDVPAPPSPAPVSEGAVDG